MLFFYICISYYFFSSSYLNILCFVLTVYLGFFVRYIYVLIIAVIAKNNQLDILRIKFSVNWIYFQPVGEKVNKKNAIYFLTLLAWYKDLIYQVFFYCYKTLEVVNSKWNIKRYIFKFVFIYLNIVSHKEE